MLAKKPEIMCQVTELLLYLQLRLSQDVHMYARLSPRGCAADVTPSPLYVQACMTFSACSVSTPVIKVDLLPDG